MWMLLKYCYLHHITGVQLKSHQVAYNLLTGKTAANKECAGTPIRSD